MTEDVYAYWRAALQAKTKRDLPPIHDGDVHCGHFRMRRHKDGPWVPVSVWPSNEFDHPNVAIDGKIVEFEQAQDRATFFLQNPITQAQFDQYAETGTWWDEVAGMGHNHPPADAQADMDEHAQLQAKFDELAKQAQALVELKVETQDQADKNAAVAKALDKIASEADKKRKAEKQPHLDAGKAVDDKWRTLTTEPKGVATKLKRTLDAFMREQERLRREEAERLRQEAMAEAKRSDNTDSVTEKFEQAQALEQTKTTIGTTGAKVRMREVVSAVITDMDKVLADPEIRRHPEFQTFIQQLCDRAVRAGKTINGVERKEERIAA